MILACLGDSLTEGDYGLWGKRGIANVQEKGYPYFLARFLGCEVKNYGKCGFKASAFLRFYDEGAVNVKDADAVLIMLGTNGGMSASGDSPENRAYTELISRVRRDAPRARIFLLTPPHATEDPKWSNCGYAPQVEQAVLFTRAEAARQKLPLIDIYADPRLQPGFEDWFQQNDGLHMTELGYQKLAERVYYELKKALRPEA